ncbi:hypothetical protein DL771_007445 [Monosporascus sp. 5C6A]|nr:hypothetical protein DL771_007445 [Monosporascus sp. 5C6A]
MIQKIPTDASEDGPEYCYTGKGYQWYETTDLAAGSPRRGAKSFVYYDISIHRDLMRTRDVFRPTRDLMRHAIHASESLESAVSTAMEMQRCRAEIYKGLPRNLLGKTYEQQANECAAFQISAVGKLRSGPLQHRLLLLRSATIGGIRQLWIYRATIIPVTIAVIVLWYLWLYKQDAILEPSEKIGAWCWNVARESAKQLMKRSERRGGSKDAEAGLS